MKDDTVYAAAPPALLQPCPAISAWTRLNAQRSGRRLPSLAAAQIETAAVITRNITGCSFPFSLSPLGAVEQDNGAKVHFSLINYPLLFLQATHTLTHTHSFSLSHTHTHTETKRLTRRLRQTQQSLCCVALFFFFRRKQEEAREEEEGNISGLSILSSTGASQSSLEITNA